MSASRTSSDVPGDPGSEGDGIEAEVWETLDEIPDPHIPVSLVELAMIYGVDVDDGHVEVELTFPCMGCPAYEFVHDDIRGALRLVDGIDSVAIEVVWEPLWSKDMLTADVRDKLAAAGIGL